MRSRGALRCLIVTAVMLSACRPGPRHSVIPMPLEVETSAGSFTLDAGIGIALDDPADTLLRRVADVWASPYRERAGLPLVVGAQGAIRLSVRGRRGAAAGDGAGAAPRGGVAGETGPGAGGAVDVLGAEGYRLDVTAEGVSIVGVDHAGVFYGLQTLSQLMPPGTEAGIVPTEGIAIGAVSIVDEPRFGYRGMHLDVARHFYGPDFVKRYIDLLARYKINRFHWHLTDDQGWRIEIDAYPRLAEVASQRAETHVGHGSEPYQGDGRPHGGYYTKDEIRDVVAYARDRHVTIIPEIEMPGHATAALAAYPELACTDGPFEVARTWGVFEDIFCPYEETFEFLETVLDEVVELFPGDYVHIGGDEVPKDRWEESEYVQDLMFREGMHEVEQVQGWFLRRIARHLAEHGKRMIGWDEILEGGLPSDATVMSWRGTLGGIEASRMGHDVVMTPYSHLYFDYYQSEDRDDEPFAIGGFIPLDTVYAFEPIPGPLRQRDAARIIGAQANVWTEYMTTAEHVEYMLLPRMLALSEVVWSPKEARDYGSFLDRLDWHLARFDTLGVSYRAPDR